MTRHASDAPIIAVDMLGGDGAPDVVVDAVAALLKQDATRLLLVGPETRCVSLLAERGVDADHPNLQFLNATRAVAMDDDPLRSVRAHADVTARVAAEAVRDGCADGWVSVGHSGAAVAASVFAMGRQTGVARPPLAVVLPALAGPVVLLDVGAGTTASSDLLTQFALVGAAYAHSLGVTDPTVGLVTIGAEPGKGDELRRETDERLRTLLPDFGVRYVGPVEGHDVALGERASVCVTDGFTGNVLLKGIEGTLAWATTRIGHAYGDATPADAVVDATRNGDFAGGMLLGVKGICVVGHGAATPEAVVACVRLADRVVTHDLVGQTEQTLAALVARRERDAGLPVDPTVLP